MNLNKINEAIKKFEVVLQFAKEDDFLRINTYVKIGESLRVL